MTTPGVDTFEPLPPTWRRVAAVWWAFYWRLMAVSMVALLGFLLVIWRGAPPARARGADSIVVVIGALVLLSRALMWAVRLPYEDFEVGVSDGDRFWRGAEIAKRADHLSSGFAFDVVWRSGAAFLLTGLALPPSWLADGIAEYVMLGRPTAWLGVLFLLPSLGSVRMLCLRPPSTSALRLVFLPRVSQALTSGGSDAPAEGQPVSLAQG